MKKKILLGACAALFLGAGITTARISMRTSNESELLVANLEALASVEVDAGFVKDIRHDSGDENGFYVQDGDRLILCTPHWEAIQCWNESPSGQWCQSHYVRTIHCL